MIESPPVGASRVGGRVTPSRAWCGLGARLDRTNHTIRPETRTVGRLTRSQLAEAFSRLKGEFEWARKEAQPGDAFQLLANRHTESLLFGTPHLGLAIDSATRTLEGLVEYAKE